MFKINLKGENEEDESSISYFLRVPERTESPRFEDWFVLSAASSIEYDIEDDIEDDEELQSELPITVDDTCC